jgi:hypothetical protein
VDHLDSAIVYRDGLAGLLETQDGQRPSQGDVAQVEHCQGGGEQRICVGEQRVLQPDDLLGGEIGELGPLLGWLGSQL